MKDVIAVSILACALATPAAAQRPQHNESHATGTRSVATHAGAQSYYQNGRLIEMSVVACNSAANDDPAALLISDDADSRPQKSKSECLQYKLQTEKAVYVIRPLDTRHPDLLPVGEMTQFRIKGDHLALKRSGADGTEREYRVLLVTAQGPEVAEDVTVW